MLPIPLPLLRGFPCGGPLRASPSPSAEGDTTIQRVWESGGLAGLSPQPHPQSTSQVHIPPSFSHKGFIGEGTSSDMSSHKNSLTHRPSSQGWVPECPLGSILYIYLSSCLVWCPGCDFSFFPSMHFLS